MFIGFVSALKLEVSRTWVRKCRFLNALKTPKPIDMWPKCIDMWPKARLMYSVGCMCIQCGCMCRFQDIFQATEE